MDARTWGTTAAERASHFPCDDIAFASDAAFYRAVSIAAPPALVFRWLGQLRYAPYSYDLLDNFGRRSPRTIAADAPPLRLGARAMHLFAIVAFEPERSLTLALESALGRALMGDLAGSYRIDPMPFGTRLVAKVRYRFPRGRYGAAISRAMPWLDLAMFRKQLLTLRALCERDALA